jgi:predicted HicB family RNase H-like nuclease
MAEAENIEQTETEKVEQTETEKVEDQVVLERIYRVAYDRYCQNPDWVSFFRDILGLSGLVRQCFVTRESMAAFERTDTYAEIQQMLTRLRERSADAPPLQEATKVITVRLPKSLHDALRAEAHDHHTSMNKLCISKLLQFIDTGLVPSDT